VTGTTPPLAPRGLQIAVASDLGAFYLAQWAVVGAAFLAWQPGGFAVLVTYFACLAATAWSYRRVGHGAIA
jgi:hypothetical protein